jgi:DNA-binding NtrC family response regulator
MQKIVILDNNQASSAFLKIILARHWHQVTRVATIQEVANHLPGSTPSLVLINQAFGNHSGWERFNHLKRIAPHIPAMVYWLDQLNAANADWIVKAVEAVIGEMKKPSAMHMGVPVDDTRFTARRR